MLAPTLSAGTYRAHARVLWLLLGAFFLRVLGQVLVAFWSVSFLPPMEEWFSGVLQYPKLLASQCVILALCVKICLDVTRGHGYFARPHSRLAIFLNAFGRVYLLVMVLRYVYRMSLYPHERWIGGSIPIFFHGVLASFLLVLGHFQKQLVASDASNKGFRAWRMIAWSFVFVLLLCWSVVQLGPWILGSFLHARPTEYAVRVERDVPMTTSDSIRLYSTVYHPMRLPHTPTLLVRAPLPTDLKTRVFIDLIGRYWAEHGYTVVVQRSRGCPPSEGMLDPLRSERRDGKETLDWLSRQSWFNGKIGTWGGSAFGYSQWALADRTDPSVSAMMIYESASDPYQMFYPGGAFSLSSALFWALRTELAEMPGQKILEKGFESMTAVEADDHALRNIPYFDDWATHREKDGYWKGLDMSGHLRDLRGPVLMLAGWFDPFLSAQLKDYAELRTHANKEVVKASRLILGPWGHAQSIKLPGGYQPRGFRFETLANSLDWFDSFLQPASPVGSGMSPVRLFVMGKNIWRDESEWPLARAREVRYFLNSDGHANGLAGKGRLEIQAPSGERVSDNYVHDPGDPIPTLGGAVIGHGSAVLAQNAAQARQDVLVYSSPALDKDLEATGPLSVVLQVQASSASADFVAKLTDVYPDGTAYLVSDGVLRSRFSKGTKKITIEMWPTSYVFMAGHKLRLEISSSDYPRFDRNPMEKMDLAVVHGRSTLSYLILPVIPSEAVAK